jgi:hypothetical protein
MLFFWVIFALLKHFDFFGVSRYKGTVVAVFPDKLKFSVDYDDGEQETLEFGKEKVRLLSTNKKS